MKSVSTSKIKNWNYFEWHNIQMVLSGIWKNTPFKQCIEFKHLQNVFGVTVCGKWDKSTKLFANAKSQTDLLEYLNFVIEAKIIYCRIFELNEKRVEDIIWYYELKRQNKCTIYLFSIHELF